MSNKIITTSDGSHSILSEKFGVTYHSIHGAIQETQHVFIDAGLDYQAQQKSEVSILEIGWGTGLNSYMTLLESDKRKLPIHYTTIEAYPISLKQAKGLNYAENLQQEDPQSFLQLHELEWEKAHAISPFFNFTKYQMLFEKIDFNNQFDIIYFDAFAPNAQAEFWEEDFLSKMYQSLQKGGILVTYCAKGSFKRALKAAGFTVESIPGPPMKREMVRAIKV
ncbi:MAG: tRNA U34 5-methylaminomethyl-2-thiouridine-forming methyltransferase MnmC [Maribacter sp.]|jgi:tRNA U34 5-methylaminomethyl-2-thiouridine-forming methyltransferase MnmC